MVTIGNIDILETWLYERTGSRLSNTDFESLPTRPCLGQPQVQTALSTGRHPPAKL
ncbi:hypothetical protein ACFWUW_06355 [Streptomyces sp. NPDC058655]|uniref:hypothetical protein n=1 Tax=Streptomyces sp. NPDC058655 TaxID=3346577 RepID=UPI00365DA552